MHRRSIVALLSLAVVVLCGPWRTMAADDAFRGSISRTPGNRWEEAFVTGNGRLGAVLFGSPTNGTLVANHARLFLPLGNREIVPDLARYLPELRRTIREQNYGEAMRFLLGKAKEQGYPGIIPTDPYHPAFFVTLRQPADGAIRDYERTEDFRTGEVTEHWRDDRGEFRRRLFVSREDNLIALSATGPGPCELQFPEIGQPLIRSKQETGAEWVTWHNVYEKGKGGYDAAARIVSRDAGRDVLLLIRIAPWKTPLPKETSEAWAYAADNPDFTDRAGVYRPAPPLAESSVTAYRAASDAEALLSQVKAALASVRADYAALFEPHAKAHAALFDRATLDLGGGADRGAPTADLLDRAVRESHASPALLEKMYDAGRYMLICAAGEMAPNLQGIWTGSWKPAWSGDFTLDTNVQSALASACSANLPDLLQGYFRMIEDFYPEWRLNARRIYGCRGFFSNARASNTCLMLHWGTWQGVFWTAGSGWLASFFGDYADYTGDGAFLEKRCMPLYRGIAEFYEDFLAGTEGTNGRCAFLPSYNPEAGCGESATMDIAVAREVLMRLIAASRATGTDTGRVPGWEALLAKLPDYTINKDGMLPEFPERAVSVKHRHHSQLYPCFQSLDPLFETDAGLRSAAQATVRAKILASDNGGEDSSFSRVQAGVAAAYLRMSQEAFSRVDVMAVRRSMNPSLITSHNPNARTFNTDGNGGIPHIVNSILVGGRAGRLDVLPALPQEWPKGAIRGILARGQLTVDRLAWDRPAGRISLKLISGKAQTIVVRFPDGVARELALRAGEPGVIEGGW